jgi:hypothetical protein
LLLVSCFTNINMATTLPPLRTPSPKIRIRSQSFDSPSSRITDTPIEESPFSRSTGSLATKALPQHDVLEASQHGMLQPLSVLLPLHTRMSDESMLSDTSSNSSSGASSPIDSDEDAVLRMDSPSSPTQRPRQRPHPLTFCQSITDDQTPIDEQPPSPFLYQDESFPMYSPWLVRVVLDMHDVRGLDWMSIAEPVERMWGVQTNSAEVLSILSDNGRVLNRRWWD